MLNLLQLTRQCSITPNFLITKEEMTPNLCPKTRCICTEISRKTTMLYKKTRLRTETLK